MTHRPSSTRSDHPAANAETVRLAVPSAHAAGAASRPHSAPDPDLGEQRAADIRRRAIDRVVAMNRAHTEAAWRMRHDDPLEPHGIALLYVHHDPQRAPYGFRLTAATKLWLHDDHDFDVHHRMFRFYRDLATELSPAADVRAYTDRRDGDMVEHAGYVGLAVSSLDTATGRWRDVVATASIATTDTRTARLWGRDTPDRPRPGIVHRPVEDHSDIPGSFRIVLTDGTTIVGERRGRPDFDRTIIESTHNLNFGPYATPFPWAWVHRDYLDADPAHAEVLHWMAQLNNLCYHTEVARLDAPRPHVANAYRAYR
jgi:hypothetical protein